MFSYGVCPPRPCSWLSLLVVAVLGLLSACRGCEDLDSARDEMAPEGGASDSASTTSTARPRPQLEPSRLESIELLTGGASTDEVLPLVIALHGLGDEPDNFSNLFKAFDRKARFIVPRGPLPHDKGFAWMQPQGTSDTVGPVLKRSADRVAALIDEVGASKPTKGKAIVTGFSQGGVVSFMVAVRHPERVGTAVPVSGWLPQFAWPDDEGLFIAHSPVIRALNGENDEIAKAIEVRRCVVKLRMLKLDATVRLYKGVEHKISSAMQRDLFTILRSSVAGVREPQPCEPCPGESMDPLACSQCDGGE